MMSRANFSVTNFASGAVVKEITTALPSGFALISKTYTGAAEGTSITQFASAFDPARGVGTYVALESFEGSLDGRAGSFNFLHSASTAGDEVSNKYGLIVPDSGTGELEGISGTVELTIASDGTHWMAFDHTG